MVLFHNSLSIINFFEHLFQQKKKPLSYDQIHADRKKMDITVAHSVQVKKKKHLFKTSLSSKCTSTKQKKEKISE